jgi:PRTRC genetic system protein F
MGIPAASALALPRISSVPTKLNHQQSAESTSRIALALLDLGLACDEDAAYAATPAIFVERIFNRWISERAACINILSPRFTLTDKLESFEESSDSETSQMCVGISYSTENAVWFALKDKIEALEAAAPGLGQTALSTLYRWLSVTSLAISPDFVFSLVQRFYWYGEEDEKGYLEEMEAMGEDIEDMECPVTREAFENEYPRFVYSPSETLNKEDLQNLKEHSNPLVAETATFLLSEPDREEWDRTSRPDYLDSLGSDSECIGFNLILHWDTENTPISTQATDDWQEYAFQGGCTNLYAIYQADQNIEGIRGLFAKLEQFISALAWVDKAVSLVATPTE